MKQPHSNRQPRTIKRKSEPKFDYDQALRKCEEASARIKSTSEELAACWTALSIEIATGASRTELLRRRAWCNVLELRLKEKAALLEKARHGVDETWDYVMETASPHDAPRRPVSRPGNENIFSKSWSLLLQPKSLAMAKALAATK